jgi:L-iditol 2-dehydrogenase
VETRRAGTEILPRAASSGLDVAFEVAGENDAIATAIDTLRPGGRLVLVGIPSDDRSYFTASIARRKGLTISLCRRMKATDLPRAIDLAENGRIELSSLLSERYALSDGSEAFASLSERRGLKVVVEPQRGAQ